MPKPMLVIGSVLLDIVGSYKDSEKGLKNKRGKVNFSVGGVAFNIASNLSSKNQPVAIFTCLKTNSISSKVIEDALKSSRIKEYIERTAQIGETSYVAHFHNKKLETGITSSQIEEIDFGKIKYLPKLVQNSSFVILDTNLNDPQIDYLCTICANDNKKIFVIIVSDAKFKRIYKQDFASKFEAVCVRQDELDTNKIIIENVIKYPQKVQELCNNLNTNVLYVNSELKGYYILTESGKQEYVTVQYPKIEIKNTLGANDALFSAVCATAYDQKDIKGNAVKMKIRDWVTGILQIEGSNFSNVKADKSSKKLELYKAITTIIFLLMSIASTVIGSFIPNLTSLYFGILIFAIAIFGGAAGALSREMISMLTSQNRKPLSMSYSIALGMIAGTLSSLIGILPSISSVGGIKDLAKNDLLPLMIFIISISTGIALDIFFNNISKKNPNEIADIN